MKDSKTFDRIVQIRSLADLLRNLVTGTSSVSSDSLEDVLNSPLLLLDLLS